MPRKYHTKVIGCYNIKITLLTDEFYGWYVKYVIFYRLKDVFEKLVRRVFKGLMYQMVLAFS